jgi:hypothetical protein
MAVGQTALARRIEREDEARRQQAWADRAEPRQRRRSKWAVDHLLDTGQITPDQHTAAERLAQAIVIANTPPHLAGSAPTQVHPGWDLTFATEMDRVTRHWKRANARSAARGARSWVAAAPLTTKARMRLYDRLFALPAPPWKSILNGNGHTTRICERVSSLLDVIDAYWAAMDAGYGSAEKSQDERNRVSLGGVR